MRVNRVVAALGAAVVTSSIIVAAPAAAAQINRPPDVPTDGAVRADGVIVSRCADGHDYTRSDEVELGATVSDPDGDLTKARFAIWPADQPGERMEILTADRYPGAIVTARLPQGYLRDGQRYVWTGQAEDHSGAVSGWMPECTFSADFTRPDKQPGVSSTDYPEGVPSDGPGLPGEFRLDPAGVDDIVGYLFDNKYIPAERIGGGATATFTPPHSGPWYIEVYSIDKAGHYSPQRQYAVYVADSSRSIDCGESYMGIGLPRTCTVTAKRPDTVSFAYRVNGGEEHTVPAVDGKTTIDLVATQPGQVLLQVWNISASGTRYGPYRRYLTATTQPFVHSDTYPELGETGGPGVPGEFVFKPRTPNATEYQYKVCEGWFDCWPVVTVPANPDGTATTTFTPAVSGLHSIEVRSVSGGVTSEARYYQFAVNP